MVTVSCCAREPETVKTANRDVRISLMIGRFMSATYPIPKFYFQTLPSSLGLLGVPIPEHQEIPWIQVGMEFYPVVHFTGDLFGINFSQKHVVSLVDTFRHQDRKTKQPPTSSGGGYKMPWRDSCLPPHSQRSHPSSFRSKKHRGVSIARLLCPILRDSS